MEEQRQKLAEALKEEHERLKYRGLTPKQLLDSSLAIHYLKTGEYPSDYLSMTDVPSRLMFKSEEDCIDAVEKYFEIFKESRLC